MDLYHTLCDVESLQEADLLFPSLISESNHLLSPESCRGDEEGRLISDSQLRNHDEISYLLPEERKQNAIAHYHKFINLCTCTPRCSFDGSKDLSLSFARMSEATRVNTVRCMLLVISAPPDCPNTLMQGDARYAQARKQVRREPNKSARTSTRYAIKGMSLSAHSFAAIVQLHPRTLTEYASAISSSMEFATHEVNERNRRKGILSSQSIVAISFLARFGELNAMACPTGRGSAADIPVLFLPNNLTKSDVHAAYCLEWESIMNAHLEETESLRNKPRAPLTKPAFCKVWNSHVGTLKIMKIGNDFCDTCTKLGDYAFITDDLTAKEALLTSRNKHREVASREFHFYKSMQRSSNPTQTNLHLVFDFAEKVLLPKLQRQPGQPHFVTGLKFDFFGVHISNSNSTDIIWLA